MQFLFKILCSCLIVLTLFSCKKETSWDVDAAIPIARSNLNISNFFGDTIFKADPTGLLHIAFSKDIVNYTMDSLVKLPDTTVKIEYIAVFNSFLAGNTTIFTNSAGTDKEIKFDVNNGVELSKAIVRTGGIKIEYFNSYTQPLNFNYDINSATLWGNIMHVNQTIGAGSISNPTKITKYYPLNGYSISMTGISLNKVNTLVQTYTISTDVTAVGDNLLAGEGLTVKISFVDIVPEYIQGYFGKQDLSFGPDSSAINFLGNFKPSNLMLTQSAINFRIINEFGVEMSSSFDNLKSIKTNPPNVVTLNAGSLLQSININRAGKTNNPSNPVFPWVQQININNTNSNLNPFLENLPNYFGYSVQAKINPLGNVSAGNDFAYFGHGLKVIADIDIPLALSANSFYLVNYANVDLTNLKELNNVNYCDLNLQARNNYPFDAKLQGYMLNDQNQIIDSLFMPSQNTVQSASTDINNNVLNYVDTKLTVSLGEDKVANLRLCKRIKFVIQLFLPNQPTPIKLKDSSYLDLVLSANVNYRARVK